MSWGDFGAPALEAIRAALAAAPLNVTAEVEVTTGEPAYECQGTIVAAWISNVTPTPGDIAAGGCVFVPRVTWTIRLHHCQDPNAPGDHAAEWHQVLEATYCALTAHLATVCQACPLTFDGVLIPPPSGTQIIADYTVTLEETCPNDS